MREYSWRELSFTSAINIHPLEISVHPKARDKSVNQSFNKSRKATIAHNYFFSIFFFRVPFSIFPSYTHHRLPDFHHYYFYKHIIRGLSNPPLNPGLKFELGMASADTEFSNGLRDVAGAEKSSSHRRPEFTTSFQRRKNKKPPPIQKLGKVNQKRTHFNATHSLINNLK